MNRFESLNYAYRMLVGEINYIEKKDHWAARDLEVSYHELRGAHDLLKDTLRCLYKYENRKPKKNNKWLKELLFHFRITAKIYSDYRKKAFEKVGLVGQKYIDFISDLKKNNISRLNP